MTTKIVRGDGVTELTGIKSCVFTERVNAEENLRPGCVSSASIDVEVFGSQVNAISAGEELTYYQVDSNGNETLIGVFYARPSIPTKNTYKFTAYDAVSKLEVDFSERLYSISASFPMTIKDIVDEACSVAGVTLASSSWPLSTQTVNEFYSDGVTCRQILAWAAEIACCFVHCDTSGELVFDWYATKSGYKVYPTSGSNGGATYVPYKQDGLNYENYNVDPIQFVAVRPIDTEGVAYVYPSTFVDVTATDPLEDGNVVLADISVADDGAGNITVQSSINITDDGHGNLTITNGGTGSGNTLVIFDNLLLCDATTATMTAVAQNLYNRMSIVGTYRPATIELFPFDNPFRAGDMVSVEDAQGVSFTTIIMEMEVSRDVAQAISTGKKQQEDVPANGQSRLARLGENIVRLNKLKVGWADIEEAIIQFLKLYGLMEVYEDNTLNVSGGQLGFLGGNHNNFGNGIYMQSFEPYVDSVDGETYYRGSGVGSGKNGAFIANTVGLSSIPDSTDFDFTDWTTYIQMFTRQRTSTYPNAHGAISLNVGGKYKQSGVWYELNNALFRTVLPTDPIFATHPEAIYNEFHGFNEFDNITVGGKPVAVHTTKTVSSVTSSNGNVSLGLNNNYGIISVRRTDSQSIVFPYWNTGNNTWYAHVVSVSNMSAVVSESVDIEVVYYPTTTR